MKLYLSILLIPLFYFVNNAEEIQASEKAFVKSKTINDSAKKYQVIKLDSIKNVYIIYAKQKDNIHKILSLNKKMFLMPYERIAVNGFYDFKLKSLFLHGPESLPLVTGIDFYGNPITIEKDCVNDLFEAENVKGLFFTGNQ